MTEAERLQAETRGGAGTVEHFLEAAVQRRAQALLAASVFHFGAFSIRQVNEYLWDNGISVRL